MNRLTLAAAALCCISVFGADQSRVVKNVTIYREPGRFGGWPANNGIWVWGNEIVVGFIQGYFKNTERGHAIDADKPSVTRFARSKDGGLTWKIEVPSFLDAEGKEQDGTECPGGLDFTAPNSAVALRMVSSSRGFSRFYYSKDRAKTWEGPYKLPTFDRKGIAARTDYIVDGKHELTAMITASKRTGVKAGFCAREPATAVRPGTSSPGLVPSRVDSRSCPHRSACRRLAF